MCDIKVKVRILEGLRQNREVHGDYGEKWAGLLVGYSVFSEVTKILKSEKDGSCTMLLMCPRPPNCAL